MYGNPYINNFNQQANIDRINNQIAELQKIKDQMQQPAQNPTNLTQNFQLTPAQRETVKYAGSMEEVQREAVAGETPFFSRDMSILWLKNTKGEIRTYELTEIIPKDEKDMKIEYLQAEIEELKKGVAKDESITNANGTITDADKSKKSSSVPKSTRPNAKSK